MKNHKTVHENDFFTLEQLDINGYAYPHINERNTLIYALVLDETTDEYVFVKQKRPICYHNSDVKDGIIELAGGTVDDGELKIDALIRELREEVGLAGVNELTVIGNYNATVGIFGKSDTTICLVKSSDFVEPLNDVDEDIEVVRVKKDIFEKLTPSDTLPQFSIDVKVLLAHYYIKTI